ncbi:hypothetical protein [Euzebya sp.]|uniref:hypothetical protein n=1 Tax=Euzebya sp. TaxID=1971409 RepID=UPI003511A448
MSSSTAEWLLEISGLTVGARPGGPDGTACDAVTQGRALASQLRAAAATHMAYTECVDGGCGAGCPLAAIDGGAAACRLAGALAIGVAVPQDPTDRDRAARTYLQALQAAATAVFGCRRHAHPTGECWFSDDFSDGAGTPGTDVCGDVLAVAHRVCA